ncbi:two-component system sensor histidine kinase NtrB [Sphingomonas bacterium]|uniref:two-component system sensor histidine kinase NtrB n=1 Tax=Sphingomonas bacterium TaxID=1895847 RepID=UPI0020C6A5F1|nr:ATP-binding protein [Sphingomonas bacterium]
MSFPPRSRGLSGKTATELFSAMPTPLLAVDEAGLIQEVNAAAEQLLVLSRAALAGVSVHDAIGYELNPTAVETPLVAYGEELVLPGGRGQRADVLIAPWPERAGWSIIALHAQSSAASIARRSRHGSGTLTAAGAAAMLAHEIKNPLSGIRGAAQLLESGLNDEAQALTRLIRDEVDRIAALIDRMEGFTDTRPLETSAQNIHAILGHARSVATTGLPGNVKVQERYDPSLPHVLVHRDSLVQVLINLIKNAAEALGPHGGEIVLTSAYRHGVGTVTERGGQRRSLPIEVCVIDDGPGAPADLAEHLFDPFITSKPTGRGLGLALVHKLIADQGGIVEYAREGRPERTVFRILLPRAPRAAEGVAE